MGLQLSRLALAVALSLQLAAPMYAADQLDDFYIEIKGPDKPAPAPSPAVTTPEAAPAVPAPEARPVRSQAPAHVKKRAPAARAGVIKPFSQEVAADAPISEEKGPVYGPVAPTDTLWSIAQKVRPSEQVSLYQTVAALYRLNPQAFAGNRINGLYKGVRLQVPTLAQIKRESDAEGQTLVRRGYLKLSKVAPVASKTAAAAVAPAPAKTIKLTPNDANVEQATEPVKPVDKPVVKLSPESPGVSAAVSMAEPAQPASEQSGSKLVINGQDANHVDPAVTALVQRTGSAASTTETTVSAAQPASGDNQAWRQEYEGKIAELTKNNTDLNSQVSRLQQDLDSLKKLVQQPPSAAVSVAKPAEPPAGLLNQLLLSPINLALIIALPLLGILALIAFWLMMRSRKHQQDPSQTGDESAELMMAQDDSSFDHLLAADVVALHDMPDLNQADETLPQVALEPGDRKEPAFSIPSSFNVAETGRSTDGLPGSSELVPDHIEPVIDLEPHELDLAIHDADNEPQELDESAFLAELDAGVNGREPMVTLTDEPAVEPADAHDEFVPRDNLVLSNDELDALFSNMDSLEEAEPVDLAAVEDVSPATALDMPVAAVPVEPVAVEIPEPEPVVESELVATLAPLPVEPAAVEAAPIAPVISEDVAADDIDALLAEASASKPVFKGIDELLAEADAASPEKDEPYQGLSLDVGLDEYPEVLPQADGYDVDAEGELAAKLDLARAYLEIDDKSSAIELLTEVKEHGSSQQQTEAERLLKRLS